VSSAELPATRPKSPRRLSEAGAGATGASAFSSCGSATVAGSGVRSSVRSDRVRSVRSIVGSLRPTWTTKPAMKIQAPQ